VRAAKSRARPVLLVAFLAGLTTTAFSQQTPGISDVERAEINSILRRFYFNLDHRDWEALTSDVLAAKVMAHRPVPTSLLTAFGSDSSRVAVERPTCRRNLPGVDQAVLARSEDWVEVVVPRCPAGLAGADRFRLVRFENRWRFVHIQLAQDAYDLYTSP
jgi:hypothetical protein